MRDKILSCGWRGLVLCGTLLVAVNPAVAQVTVDGTVSGDTVPGGTAMVAADVEITDGSTIVSYLWTQTGGVTATLSNTTTDTVTLVLGSEGSYKDQLVQVLAEPPIDEADLPPNVPAPEGEFPGGLQDRFYVPGINHFALEEGGLVTLDLEVVTTSGTYNGEIHVVATLPWRPNNGIRNVAVGEPVLVHGKDQAAYDWTASGAACGTLNDATTQDPWFTPGAAGTCTLSVTDQTVDPNAVVDLVIYADTWLGVINGQDTDGNPTWSATCAGCHNGTVAPDAFTPWSQTGHAEIFSVNLDTSTHYGEGCFDCHTVGYNTDVANGGIDDASDYDEFLAAGLLNVPGDNWTTMLSDYLASAQLANIQCENCHGPNATLFGGAHASGSEARESLSSDVCARCHGEPARHARFQQWQLSGHANYELAVEEGQDGSCARCHTGNGFLAWLPALLDGDPSNDYDEVTVTWTEDETHPQTCQTCHDPHSIGDASGDANNATVRISGDTPLLAGGYTATDVGRGAICMTCHNTRRGLRNDTTFPSITDRDRAPHLGAQGDTLMGENHYFVTPGSRGAHSDTENVADTCATCHMEATPPPADLSYQQGGTNHTFFARNDICSECHTDIDNGDAIQSEIEGMISGLLAAVETAWENTLEAQLAAGATVDLDGAETITAASQILDLEFAEGHGRMELILTTAAGVFETRLSRINVTPTMGDATTLDVVASDELIKASWNLLMAELDESDGVHNYVMTSTALGAALAALGQDTSPCEEDAETACLNGGRFEVTVDWQRPPQAPGIRPANVSTLGTDDSALFYFNNPDNLEFLIKVLDGCTTNEKYWVLFAGTTDVEFTLRVRDSDNGVVKSYTNTLAHPANAVVDINVFATCP